MNTDLKIRNYKYADFKTVNQLWECTGMGGIERGNDHNTINNTIKAGGKLFILENTENGEIIGTAWLTNDGRRIYMHHFCIKPEYQGKAYSKLLLKESLLYAKRVGMQIKLEVHQSNLKATELYKRAGFKYLGDYNVYIIRNPKPLKDNI